MNSFINRILCICVLIFSSLAMAGGEVSKETIFVNSTTTERWPDFRKLLEVSDGISPLGNLRTITLAEAAYGYAKDEGFPAGKMSFGEFNSLFKEQNHLVDIISEAEFLDQARAGKIFLPVVKESVANSVPIIPVKTEESAALKAQAQTLAELEKKVEQLSLVVAKNSTWQKNWEEKIGGFFNQFNSLKNKVAALGQEQGNLVQTQASEFKKLAAELTGKSDRVNFLVTDQTKVVSGLQADVKSLKSDTITIPVLQRWFGIAGAVLTILFLLAFWFIADKFKKVKTEKVSVTAFKEVKDSVSSVKDNLGVIEEVILQLQTESEANKDVVLEKNLQAKLKELNWDNATFKTIVKKKDKQYVVTVTYKHTMDNGNRYVMLGGIIDQSEPVSLKKVSSVLYKAANDHRLQNENFEVVKEAA